MQRAARRADRYGPSVTLDATPSPAAGVTSVELDGETVVLHEDRAQLHHLDAVATAVWARLDGRTSLRETCLALAEDFGVDLDKVQADVTALVERLAGEGLIRLQ
jgi:hypothetical protein